MAPLPSKSPEVPSSSTAVEHDQCPSCRQDEEIVIDEQSARECTNSRRVFDLGRTCERELREKARIRALEDLKPDSALIMRNKKILVPELEVVNLIKPEMSFSHKVLGSPDIWPGSLEVSSRKSFGMDVK